MLVSWHVSETGHLWRSVGAQAFALAVADGTIDWSGVDLVMRFAPKRRAGSVSADRGGECVSCVSLLGGTASRDLNAELLHPGVKGRPLHSQSRRSAIRAGDHPVGRLERLNDVSTLCLVEH